MVLVALIRVVSQFIVRGVLLDPFLHVVAHVGAQPPGAFLVGGPLCAVLAAAAREGLLVLLDEGVALSLLEVGFLP